MLRSCFALVAALLVLSTAKANISVLPLHAGAVKKADPTAPAQSPQKIIDQLKADYDKVLDRLNADDPGDETRRNQQRILEGIDELLRRKDPDPSKNSSANSPPNPKGNREPSPKQPVGNPKETAAPVEQKQPARPEPKPVAKTQPAVGKEGNPPNTPEDLRKEMKTDGFWPSLPPRHRADMEAFGRERFIPAYQELLREYYRNLAQGSRSKDE